jgi:ribose-phosphate pyrophosphokinase
MSGKATELVENSELTEVIFTDSIPYDKVSSKVKILSIADMFADTIQRVYDNRSISSQYLI